MNGKGCYKCGSENSFPYTKINISQSYDKRHDIWLCKECYNLWVTVYNNTELGCEFNRAWHKAWNKFMFMSLKEKVIFT